ncbi:hypothetical protein Nepgr_031072 [Nepenthes gracilis]|uniref:Cupin type-1 domain-containing protein n=1 Tax=Nepenthes gracilis TaxID=150966 RepID=A0AAD3THE4_NEPGR|nr:hypothetical protein Nepgr_031072 [Nepenthes gracilis]
MGVTIPGCQETYQSESRSERGSERLRDEHQKIRRFREGDVFAMPAGVAKWIYNDGDSPAICVTLYDISSSHNQLDQNLRNFYLAGNPQQRDFGSERRRRSYEEGNNIFTGFDQDLLADAYGVSVETINKLQGVNDNRGNIVRVERSLEVLRPEWRLEEEEIREERRRESENGIEETFCTIKLIENTNNPSMADLFNPRGGRITTIDSKKLTILDYLQLSAERVVLYRDAIMAPHWHVNAHSVVYVTRGSGRIQVANDNGRLVFDQQVQEGQLLVIPQNFVAVKKASSEGLEFIAFKTNGHAIGSTLAGEGSAMRGMPMEVLMNSFRVSRKDARQLKYGRREMVVFGPRRLARSREGEDPFSIV